VTVGKLDERQLASGRGDSDSTDELGITVEDVTAELANRFGLSANESGVVVTHVEPGSLAARVGIRAGDLIVAVGNKTVRDLKDYRDAMKNVDLKRGVRLQVMREGTRRFVFIRTG
jgi:serine protease Do